MFYSHQILARKGPLGVIWLAAHLDKKLRRQQVFQADIPDSVEAILYSTEPRALRLSGQLLLGVARIYSRKVGYLYTDCSDAMFKLKQVRVIHECWAPSKCDGPLRVGARGTPRGGRLAAHNHACPVIR